MGAKFCPVELDIDRARLEKDLEQWCRRIRIKAHFGDSEDLRTAEEKRFYLPTGWTPKAGSSAAVDFFYL